MKLEEIAAEAAKFPEEARAALASSLLHDGLESPVYEVSDGEISERGRMAEEDPGVWLTFDQLVSGLHRRVG